MHTNKLTQKDLSNYLSSEECMKGCEAEGRRTSKYESVVTDREKQERASMKILVSR